MGANLWWLHRHSGSHYVIISLLRSVYLVGYRSVCFQIKYYLIKMCDINKYITSRLIAEKASMLLTTSHSTPSYACTRCVIQTLSLALKPISTLVKQVMIKMLDWQWNSSQIYSRSKGEHFALFLTLQMHKCMCKASNEVTSLILLNRQQRVFLVLIMYYCVSRILFCLLHNSTNAKLSL